jgi:hypothetical protein
MGDKGITKKMKRMQSHIRRFIKITFHINEKTRWDKDPLIEQILKTFNCQSIILAKTKAHKGIIEFHMGIRNDSASKNTAPTKILQFPQFKGKQNSCSIRFYKGWGTLCKFLIQVDPEPYIWGEDNLDAIMAIATASKKKRKLPQKVRELPDDSSEAVSFAGAAVNQEAPASKAKKAKPRRPFPDRWNNYWLKRNKSYWWWKLKNWPFEFFFYFWNFSIGTGILFLIVTYFQIECDSHNPFSVIFAIYDTIYQKWLESGAETTTEVPNSGSDSGSGSVDGSVDGKSLVLLAFAALVLYILLHKG